MGRKKKSETPSESVGSSSANRKALTSSSEILNEGEARKRRTRVSKNSENSGSASETVGKRTTKKTSGTTAEKEITREVKKSPRSRKAKVEQAVADRLAGKRSTTNITRSGDGDKEPARNSICKFCGGSFKRDTGEIHTFKLNVQLDDKRITTREIKLCSECIYEIPAHISGVMHILMNMPKDKFHGMWTYPSIELELVDTKKE